MLDSWRTRVTLGALVALVVFGIGAYVVHSAADGPIPDRADAIVALAGNDDRADLALDLFIDGVAPRLVLSHDPTGSPLNRHRITSQILCANPPDGVSCFSPDPATTRGEALGLRRLTALEGWTDIVVVTAGYHVRRAEMLIDQCVPVDLTMVKAPYQPAWFAEDAWFVIHETGGLLDALIRPECYQPAG